MNISADEKKTEAIARMKLLGIFPPTIEQFEQDGYVSISEPPDGAFFWAEGNELMDIRAFEAQYNALVYAVVRTYTTVGKLDSYLYVSDHPDEWEADREELEHMEPFVYVHNHNAPDCSEFGRIWIEKTPAAGLLRTV